MDCSQLSIAALVHFAAPPAPKNTGESISSIKFTEGFDGH
jgi:hypothetical protein